MITHYWQLVKRKGKWQIVADSTDRRAFVDRKGAVIIEADSRTSAKKIIQLAEEKNEKA